MNIIPHISHSLDEAVRAIALLKSPKAEKFLEESSILVAKTFREGGKLLIAGNGGSLSDATHFAEELTGCFRKKEKLCLPLFLGMPPILLVLQMTLALKRFSPEVLKLWESLGISFVESPPLEIQQIL